MTSDLLIRTGAAAFLLGVVLTVFRGDPAAVLVIWLQLVLNVVALALIAAGLLQKFRERSRPGES